MTTELTRLRIEVETLRTLLAAWQKRCYEAERTNPHGEPVDPAVLEPFIREMREKVIPSIVEAVSERQRRAAETRDLPLTCLDPPDDWMDDGTEMVKPAKRPQAPAVPPPPGQASTAAYTTGPGPGKNTNVLERPLDFAKDSARTSPGPIASSAVPPPPDAMNRRT